MIHDRYVLFRPRSPIHSVIPCTDMWDARVYIFIYIYIYIYIRAHKGGADGDDSAEEHEKRTIYSVPPNCPSQTMK